MKKSMVIILLLLVAVASSAGTIFVQKIIRSWGGKVVIITDARCKECDITRLVTSLKADFQNTNIETLDFGQAKGKKLYESEGLESLPAVLFPKNYIKNDAFKRYEQMAKQGKKHYILTAGGFDPQAEICDNNIDDNGDGLIDCADVACKKNWRCMEKREKPDVDVFVMSHCPYGLQIEKGIIPVWDLLGDKINLNIRYVDYAMHGKKEVDEELKQYCVAEQGKLKNYLRCFVKAEDSGERCNKEANVDTTALTACIKKTDETFGVSKAFEDKSKWKGSFPPFPIDAEIVQKYGVSGSPTLVINGATAKTGRNPKALLDAICTAFTERPKECEAKIETADPSPGFGIGKTPAGEKGSGQAKCKS